MFHVDRVDVHKGEGSVACGQGEGMVKNLIFVDVINGWSHMPPLASEALLSAIGSHETK